MAILKVLVLCFVVGAVNSFSLWEPCTINGWTGFPERFTDPEKTEQSECNATCVSGRVYWNNPERRIRVNFPGNVTNVCVRQGDGSEGITVYKYDDGTETELTLDEDGRVCLEGTNSDGLTLILEGPEGGTYMAHYTYEPPRYQGVRERMRGLLDHFMTEVSRSFNDLFQRWSVGFFRGYRDPRPSPTTVYKIRVE